MQKPDWGGQNPMGAGLWVSCFKGYQAKRQNRTNACTWPQKPRGKWGVTLWCETMNKPVLFVLYISFACCIGFIGGMLFGGFYNQDIVAKTIKEYNEVQTLMDWYQLVVIDKLRLKDIESISNMSELETLKFKYKKNGLRNIKLFRDQANVIKKKAVNPSAIIQLENGVDEFERYFQE